MKSITSRIFLAASGALCLGLINPTSGQAASIKLTVKGTDAIYLAGRDDVVVPPPDQPFSVLGRHSNDTPEELQETLPPSIAVSAGQKLTFSATGCLNYGNGFGCPSQGSDPEGGGFANLDNLAGISGYMGLGALTGVFLTDNNPVNSLPPSALDFTSTDLGTNFRSLNPEIGQVFFIGDGVTNDNKPQTFIAPTEATRLFLGTVDGFNFKGSPGAYDDNDGEFLVDVQTVPEPLTILGSATALGFGTLLKREQNKRKKKC